MSTKIYEGCQIHVTTLLEYQEFVNDIKSLIVPEIKRLIISEAFDYATKLIDDLRKRGPGFSLEGSDNKSFIRYGYREYKKACKEDSSVWSKVHSGSAAVFMIAGKVLAVPFFGRSEITNIFKNHPKVSEYGYYDNSDKPEDISDYDWTIRHENWCEALGGDMSLSPVEAGSIIVFDEPEYQLMSQFGIWDDTDYIKTLLDKINERYRWDVKDAYVNAKAEEFANAAPKDSQRSRSSYFIDASEAYQVFKRSAEYEERCKEAKEKMVLITEELLKTKISTFIENIK